jgi:prophage regulatory protein
MTTEPTPRLLRLPEVERLSGLRRSAIYAAIKRGQFPKPRKLTAVASAWLEPEIRQWIETRPLAEPSAGPA